MKKFFIQIFFIVFFISRISASGIQLIASLPIQCDFFSVDNLGNIYAVKNDNLIKYDAQGIQQKTFTNKISGRITSIDVSNPFKIIVFYKDFSQIIFLENTLSISGSPIQLASLDLEQATLACSSYNNGFWVYESQLSQLIRYDEGLSVSQKSGNIMQLSGNEINPNFLAEENNSIYLWDKKVGILVFDRFGTYLKTLYFKDISCFQIFNNKLFYFKENSTLKIYNLQTFEESELKFADYDILSFRIIGGKMFVQKKDGIDVYLLK